VRRAALAVVLAALVLAGFPSYAGPGKPARTKPQGPAAWKFAKTVPVLLGANFFGLLLYRLGTRRNNSRLPLSSACQ